MVDPGHDRLALWIAGRINLRAGYRQLLYICFELVSARVFPFNHGCTNVLVCATILVRANQRLARMLAEDAGSATAVSEIVMPPWFYLGN